MRRQTSVYPLTPSAGVVCWNDLQNTGKYIACLPVYYKRYWKRHKMHHEMKVYIEEGQTKLAARQSVPTEGCIPVCPPRSSCNPVLSDCFFWKYVDMFDEILDSWELINNLLPYLRPQLQSSNLKVISPDNLAHPEVVYQLSKSHFININSEEVKDTCYE